MEAEIVEAAWQDKSTTKDSYPVPYEAASPVFVRLPGGDEVDWAEFTKKTPKEWILTHPQGYQYVSIEYVLMKLNKGAGPQNWVWVTDRAGWATGEEEVGPKGEREYLVDGHLMIAGAIPRYGIGGHVYRPASKMGFAAVKASAETEALKNAARKIGIGADVRTGDDVGKAVAGQQNTIKTLFTQLVKKDLGDKATKAITDIAPAAFPDGKLDPHAIEDLDGVIKILSELLINKS